MQTENFIAVNEFCSNWNIEPSFLNSLQENGMIEVVSIGNKAYINGSQLRQLEKLVLFYYELDINLEGIETIEHLLVHINTMQEEIKGLRNKLRLFEKS
jgi:chaperone modulatory protein CbpM